MNSLGVMGFWIVYLYRMLRLGKISMAAPDWKNGYRGAGELAMKLKRG
jgi:hypothetical protein